ncbi:MAG: hypothetical protein ACOCXH_15485 [Cyclobacteriaceae bacterium]
MKNKLIYLFILLMASSACVSSKKYNALQEQRNDVMEDLSMCRQRASNLEANISELRADLAELNELEIQLSSAEETISNLNEKVARCETEITDGVVFKVQIGAFSQREIPQELNQSVNLDIEEKNGMDKVVLGQFREFEKADALQKHLRDMGVDNAWIVAYEDGQRVDLDEVTDVIFETNKE